MEQQPPGTTLVFYDGVCGLCNRLNRFLLLRDRKARIFFAPLQGSLAKETLTRRGHNPSDLDTVYVIANWRSPEEQLLARSAAVLHTLRQLEGGWSAIGRLGGLIPRPLADVAYRLVARSRYRVFGRLESCPIPKLEWRSRFVEKEILDK